MLRLPVSGVGEESTSNTVYAAAFAALGMAVRTHRKHNLQTGASGMSFTISGTAINNPLLETASLHWGLLRGTLAKQDPAHPLLDAVGTLRNRAAIIHWIKRSAPQHLHVNGARALYVDGADQATLIAAGHTEDLHLVAALGRLGVPLVKFSGTAPQHRFFLPAKGFSVAGYECDVRATIEGLRSGQLEREEPQHPLHVCLRACRAYDELMRLMKAEPTMLTLEDTRFRSGWQAILREDSINDAYDNARAMFAKKGKL